MTSPQQQDGVAFLQRPTYPLAPSQVRRFRRDGHVFLPQLLPAEALAAFRDAIVATANAHVTAAPPMPWRADAPHAGFSTAEPWLPVDARHFPLAVDGQLAAADTTLARVRTFLTFRKAQPALLHGEQTLLPPRHDVLAFTRTAQNQTLLLCFNPNPSPRLLPSPTTVFAETVPAGGQLRELEGHGATPGRMGPDGLAMPPWGAWIGGVV